MAELRGDSNRDGLTVDECRSLKIPKVTHIPVVIGLLSEQHILTLESRDDICISESERGLCIISYSTVGHRTKDTVKTFINIILVYVKK